MKYYVYISLIVISFLISRSVLATNYSPEQTSYKGKVISVNDDIIEVQVFFKGPESKIVKVLNNQTPNQKVYNIGDQVFVLEISSPDIPSSYYITDHNRITPLLILFIFFSAVVIFVSKKWGLLSILGMLYSFLIIFNFTLPTLLKGVNPLLISLLTTSFIAPVTFYLSHGFNKKTTVALLSTIFTLFMTSFFAFFYITAAKLTGFGSDESFFLQIAKDGIINIKGIYLAGIIIGVLGILDDITISQTAIVFQLKTTIRGIGSKEVYKKAMEIGHDHIASAVNTLILVYTGAALPLLLLFVNSTQSFSYAINSEIIADEIVRTLVGSIGLVLAVPISTYLASITSTDTKTPPHLH